MYPRPDRIEKAYSWEAADKRLDLGSFVKTIPHCMAMVEKVICIKKCGCLEVGAYPKVIHGKQDTARCA
jgi:hypothetical protein